MYDDSSPCIVCILMCNITTNTIRNIYQTMNAEHEISLNHTNQVESTTVIVTPLSNKVDAVSTQNNNGDQSIITEVLVIENLLRLALFSLLLFVLCKNEMQDIEQLTRVKCIIIIERLPF